MQRRDYLFYFKCEQANEAKKSPFHRQSFFLGSLSFSISLQIYLWILAVLRAYNFCNEHSLQ